MFKTICEILGAKIDTPKNNKSMSKQKAGFIVENNIFASCVFRVCVHS